MEATARSTKTVDVKWSPPSDTGGRQIQGYVIQIRENDCTRWPPNEFHTKDQSYTASKLTPEVAYMFRVAARDIRITGEFAVLKEPVILLGGRDKFKLQALITTRF